MAKQKTREQPRITVDVTCLGTFSITGKGVTLTEDINRSKKMWNVLCYLIYNRDRFVPQSELMTLFWSEEKSSNPVNALKTLIYRIRALLEPVFGEDEPIIARQGCYGWNPEIQCRLDTDEMQRLYNLARGAADDEDKLRLLRPVCDIYGGDFLPRLAGQLWTEPLTQRWRQIFLDSTKQLARLLEKNGLYSEMHARCLKCTEYTPLDEELHAMTISALLRQGKHNAALSHYEKATELLYRHLGLSPSTELRALYMQIMAEEKNLETDLEAIQADLREAASLAGAFVCEYGIFREIYRLEERRCARTGQSVHIGLITVTDQQGARPSSSALNNTMDQLLDVLRSSLRRGDVISRYSAAQYVVLLPGANYEDSLMVMDRIDTAFHRQHRLNSQMLSCKVRGLK